MMLTMPRPTTKSNNHQGNGTTIQDLLERGKQTGPGMLILASVRIARLLGGLWLVAWGVLRITRAMAQATVGMGGLSVICGLSLMGVRSSKALRA